MTAGQHSESPDLAAALVRLLQARVAGDDQVGFESRDLDELEAVAPQLVARLTRSGPPQVMTSALMGALLLVVSDFIAQRAFGSTDLPVGVVTGAVGGCYLVWLLRHGWTSVST